MTEKEVETLEHEVRGETLLDPDVERTWSNMQLASLRREEQQTIYSFRLFKALRDDTRMETAATALKGVRSAIKHLNNRLAELGDM